MTLLLVVGLDQISKIYVSSVMYLHASHPVIDGFFNITYVRNPGAAFGFLANAAPMFRSLFLIIVSAAAIAMILWFLAKNKSAGMLLTFALSLILGGAVGNLLDRIRFGSVVDFLDFYIASWHWPAFNVADSAISVGAVLLIAEMLRREKPRSLRQ
ncbi:MAG: lipoprotein signal peptidase [Deltaproteobacteria bacterium]|nr:lipoprotein signal peptidase [Deltaproteobacteria bacterium]MBW2595497.1 lipoprotein signal peptidase [Deltaproteobacteria bacterium]MBW2649668.1 lipoprotein signal peptidase [Deltaproteobacteria bacterium]